MSNEQQLTTVESAVEDVSDGQFSIQRPKDALKMAAILQKYVKDNSLSTNIQGSEYVMVEGWQFAGSQLGIIPRIISTTNLSTYDEVTFEWEKWNRYKKRKEVVTHKTRYFKYSAECELVQLQTDQVVGRGIATCSNEEQAKHTFDEYAIESMAQTRAVGKGFRLLIGWLMKASGFAPVPAEEMDGVHDQQNDNSRVVQTAFTADHQKQINRFKTVSGLMDWAMEQTDLHQVEDFRAAVQGRKNQIIKSQTK